MSIASEITRLQNDSAAIAAAIAAKGVTVPSGSGFDDYATLIGQISGGGGSDPDAWLKDGDTHLWINIQNDYQKGQTLRLRMIGTIDWGDGTSESVNVTGYSTISHTYADTGKYRIDLKASSGTLNLGSTSSSYCVMGSRSNSTYWRLSALYQAEIGTKQITKLGSYSFQYCCGLRRIYIPKSITAIGQSSFLYCTALDHLEFEDVSKVVTEGSSIFYGCTNLQVLQPFTGSTATTLTQPIRACYSLREYTINAAVTDIAANSFYNCYGLAKLICKPTTPPTIANANAFTGFPSSCQIIVPAGKLTAYQTANIWSTYASQMVEASS